MNKNYLIVRTKPHGIKREDEFRKGLLSIGWPLGKPFIELDKEGIQKSNSDYNFEKTALTQIENFINLKKGDIVLVPTEERRLIIFEIISGYEYIKEKDTNEIGNPHTIKGKIIKEYPSYPETLKSLIGSSRRAVTNIEKHQEKIEKLLTKTKGNDLEKTVTKSLDVLNLLLDSKDERIRLESAIAILNHLK